jgi:hypothetical protein
MKASYKKGTGAQAPVFFVILYESEVAFRPKNFPYNADVIAVWANEIGPLQISHRYYNL